MERRRFIGRVVQLTGAAMAAIIAVPGVLAFLTPAVREWEPRWRPLGPVAEFPVGRVRQAVVFLDRADGMQALQHQGVYVWRRSDTDIVVYSRSCTDLGCPVTWDPGSEWFFCPCHGGIFDREGERRAGPPNRPLFRYAWRLVDGMLEIDVHSVPPMA